jgi:hypothetical protein
MHRRQDRCHHAIDVLQHIIVPETQHAIAIGLKISGSLCISDNVVRLAVLRAINLDDQSLFVAGEVSEVRTDRGLPPEVRVLDWQAS